MQEYLALFRENKKVKTVQLVYGTVVKLVVHSEGLSAITSDRTGEECKFWVSKKDQPLGARCQVFKRDTDAIPTISRQKADFPVRVGTVVLFVRPREKGPSAYPVLSWDDYQRAASKPQPGVSWRTIP